MSMIDIVKNSISSVGEDDIDRYRRALEIVGLNDFTFSKVVDDSFPSIPGNGYYPDEKEFVIAEGFDNLPKGYKNDIRKVLDRKSIPYLVIVQGDLINYLVVGTDCNYDLKGEADSTLPLSNGLDFVGYAYVRNISRPEYGLDHGNIGFANLGDGLSRTL